MSHPPGTVPAVLVCDPATAGLRVAGLTLADRFVVAAHRAGCHPIHLVLTEGMQPPDLRRTRAWKIPVEIGSAAPALSRPTLLARSSLLVTSSDIRVLLSRGGRLADAEGRPLPVGVVDSWPADFEAVLDSLPLVSAEGVAWHVVDRRSARAGQRALWASIKSSTDGMVDRWFNRPCGRYLSRVLAWTSVSPNMVSVISILIGVLAGWLFAAGDYATAIFAAVLFQVSAMVDCVDGDLAKIVFKESELGKWLDLVGDQVVHVSVFGGVALGLMRQAPEGPAAWLGLSAIAGALLSFAVVLRGFRLPPSEEKNRMQKFIDGATTRDFSVLVFALALAGRLDLFLWLTAFGSHAFWLTLLAVQWRSTTSAARTA